ncbi:MAG TPA: outer membrane protein assembly factor BamD [Accumulibacter sp.]|uniref:outer membrane protein assembly factor BamD n=1 Tax=Accumulibacter sp. TaxID=2053492 RepID=UPI00287B4AFA|nr:outer membrane protein assembly factor BamD [Accumulibacter sp.]MDS4056097.1 outer membrane protein assembly factor BamD [Accumulibacter sp.]HMV04020.1 outer membrane protein assembly factor BamD [Accumulibacter sp.]HMW62370.1 outer membrane protein assembly factor BamD [Accumulibacter sp.]HMW78750.1 outer membrane protein assembly factor BamD [Accumulibacter sp.]HMX67568.1 outer membrane protein assembly factor BamD [Accumulibacter sp.]
MRSLAVIATFIVTSLISGCGLLPAEKDETAGWSANKLYTEAKDALNEGSYAKAVKYFEKLESRYPYGRYAQQAQIEIAYAYWKDFEPASALAACDRFIKLHPNHPNVDYVHYLRGLINFNEDQGILGAISSQDMSERDPKGARESFDAFKELVTRFPDSKYTPDALLRMKYLVNALARLELHVARYYMKRGAYLAAANRAQYAVKNYPDTPANEEALFIMISAYDALGLTDLRDDASRVMRKNFPQSEYYTRGLAQREEPWWRLW